MDKPEIKATCECPKCGNKLDVVDMIMLPSFRIMGCTFLQVVKLCTLWRCRRLDWPPEGDASKDALKGYEDAKS